MTDRMGKFCIECPSGGVCNSTNTTLAFAQPGYWYSRDNSSAFFTCNPPFACTGGGYESCEVGFFGPRCGKCMPGYYKFRNRCIECSGDAQWRFLLGVIVLAVLTLVFFGLSSIKVHHISGLSIGFGFWQILSMFSKLNIRWPVEFDNSLTAATITNLNTDFISPECVLKGIRYEAKWGLQLSLPLMLLISFSLLYISGEIRSFIAWRIGHCIRFTYWPYIENETKEEKKKQNKVVKFIVSKCVGLSKLIRNGFIFLRNLSVWFFKQGNTRDEISSFRNKIINGYCTFLSFSFSFIMTTTSEIFVCTTQPGNVQTMDASPDILCWRDSSWYGMLPVAVIIYVLYNLGALLFFFYVFLVREKLRKRGTVYKHRFKFILQRFKYRYFFWEIVVTLRKTCIAILNIFFRPMFVMVMAIGVIFVGMLLQMNFVPYRRKFHNIMEYFILMATLILLCCGLMFAIPAEKFPSAGFRKFIDVLSIIIIISSTVFVVGMIIWDAQTRKKNDKKKTKMKKRELAELIAKRTMAGLPIDDLLYQKKTKYDENRNVLFVPPFFVNDTSESETDSKETLNQILENLFSLRRLKRKIFLVNRKRKRIQDKVKKTASIIKRKSTKHMMNKRSE